MKRISALAIIFMLVVPMFSILLPKAEADRTIESLWVDSVSGIGESSSVADTTQDEHQVIDDGLLPMSAEVYIDMGHTNTADNQYDYDRWIELYVDVDASPGPRTVDVFTYLETPNNDIVDADNYYGWVVQGTVDDYKWFYMYLGYEYMQYVGTQWHIEILVRDSSTYVLYDQKKVFFYIGPILKDHFTCRDPYNAYATATTTFYDTETAWDYTEWDTHNLWITYDVKWDFNGPGTSHLIAGPEDISPGQYNLWAAGGITGGAAGSWYVDILLEDIFRARDGFDIIATSESVTVDPNGGRIYVDSNPNPITTLKVYSWSPSSTHTLDPDSGYSPSDGRRLIFTQWNDGNADDPRTITVSGAATYRAQWQTQYRLIINVSPSGGGTTNPAIGTYWHNSGDSQVVSESPNPGYIFDHWDLDGNNVGSGTSFIVTMNDRHTLTAVFSVLVQDFDISISPSTLTIDQGKSDTATVTVEQINGYSYDVSLSASGQPSGVTISFSPVHGTPTFTSTMSVQVAYDVPEDTYSLTVIGIGSDGKTHSKTFALEVEALTIFTDPRLSVWPPSGIGPIPIPVWGTVNTYQFFVIYKNATATIEDYYAAFLQHFGIDLISDGYSTYPNILSFVIEFRQIDVLHI